MCRTNACNWHIESARLLAIKSDLLSNSVEENEGVARSSLPRTFSSSYCYWDVLLCSSRAMRLIRLLASRVSFFFNWDFMPNVCSDIIAVCDETLPSITNPCLSHPKMELFRIETAVRWVTQLILQIAHVATGPLINQLFAKAEWSISNKAMLLAEKRDLNCN